MHRAVNRSSVALQELPTRNEYSTRQRYDVDDPYSFSLQAPTSSPAVVRFGPVLSFFLSFPPHAREGREGGRERAMSSLGLSCVPMPAHDERRQKRAQKVLVHMDRTLGLESTHT